MRQSIYRLKPLTVLRGRACQNTGRTRQPVELFKVNSNRVLKWNAIFPFLELAQPGYDIVLALQTIQFLFFLFFLNLLVCVCVHVHRRSYIHSRSGVWVHVRFGCQSFLSTVRLLLFTGLCRRVTWPSGLQASPASTSRFTIAALG